MTVCCSRSRQQVEAPELIAQERKGALRVGTPGRMVVLQCRASYRLRGQERAMSDLLRPERVLLDFVHADPPNLPVSIA